MDNKKSKNLKILVQEGISEVKKPSFWIKKSVSNMAFYVGKYLAIAVVAGSLQYCNSSPETEQEKLIQDYNPCLEFKIINKNPKLDYEKNSECNYQGYNGDN